MKELPDGTLLETIDTSCLEKGNNAEMEIVPVTCLGMQEMGMCALIVREQRQRLIGII